MISRCVESSFDVTIYMNKKYSETQATVGKRFSRVLHVVAAETFVFEYSSQSASCLKSAVANACSFKTSVTKAIHES